MIIVSQKQTSESPFMTAVALCVRVKCGGVGNETKVYSTESEVHNTLRRRTIEG